MTNWTDREIFTLKKLLMSGKNTKFIAKELNREVRVVARKIWHMRRNEIISKVPTSTMPKFDQPLKSQGDAVILTDIEAPYHHADFINRVLDLADKWKIKSLHLAGDILHYDSLSSWGAEWIPDDTDGKLDILLEYIQSLPQKHQQRGNDILEKVGMIGAGGNLADELTEARRVFRAFTNFDNIYVAIGNHDDRYLRALDNAIKPRELLVQMDTHHDPRWKIAPYYYTMIETEKGLYRAEHPRGAGRTAAQDLAIQYHCYIVMGHSHRWSINRDPSGDYWAIQTGHCVDETRLAYVMQRSAKRDAHCLGATIIRGGVPWVLGEWSQWDLLKKI